MRSMDGKLLTREGTAVKTMLAVRSTDRRRVEKGARATTEEKRLISAKLFQIVGAPRLRNCPKNIVEIPVLFCDIIAFEILRVQ